MRERWAGNDTFVNRWRTDGVLEPGRGNRAGFTSDAQRFRSSYVDKPDSL